MRDCHPGRKKSPGHPPPSFKIIFLARKSIPRKIPEKSEKVASSFWRGMENYLTNRGTGAIVLVQLSDPCRDSTMNPNEVMYGDHKPRVLERVRGFLIMREDGAS